MSHHDTAARVDASLLVTARPVPKERSRTSTLLPSNQFLIYTYLLGSYSAVVRRPLSFRYQLLKQCRARKHDPEGRKLFPTSSRNWYLN